jgi:glucose/arabinose dehydrogenase
VGLRNPFGLAFSPDGKLYVTENSYDVRGSRPVWGTGDVLWEVRREDRGKWFGWPDFHGATPLTKADHYGAPFRKRAPKFLLAEHPNEPPEPVVKLGVHSSSNGIDFSRDAGFGYEGQAFIAQFGDMAPTVGKVLAPVGFKVVRVDVRNGIIENFAANKGENGPASRLKRGGLERPTGLRFSPDGSALYVVFGVVTMTKKGPVPREGTGVLWRISREGSR